MTGLNSSKRDSIHSTPSFGETLARVRAPYQMGPCTMQDDDALIPGGFESFSE